MVAGTIALYIFAEITFFLQDHDFASNYYLLSDLIDRDFWLLLLNNSAFHLFKPKLQQAPIAHGSFLSLKSCLI